MQELDKKDLLLLSCGLFFQDKQLWSNLSLDLMPQAVQRIHVHGSPSGYKTSLL